MRCQHHANDARFSSCSLSHRTGPVHVDHAPVSSKHFEPSCTTDEIAPRGPLERCSHLTSRAFSHWSPAGTTPNVAPGRGSTAILGYASSGRY